MLCAGSAPDEVGSSFFGSLKNELTLIHPLLLDRRALDAPGLGLRDEQKVVIAGETASFSASGSHLSLSRDHTFTV